MNGRRGGFDSPPDPQTAKPKRLSWSFRQSQAAGAGSPRSQQADFKTPTRISGSRAAAAFSGESPNNDSDFQQDIIWDATSPSPRRLGKRGKKHTAGVVDISEIVSRIAPKHGRPKVSEPTLQQWIGDSAAIPCTPDVQTPRPKKSLRPNGVDDLLKLAKQFDFNMFRQDEEEMKDVHQQSLDLLPDDILDLEDAVQNEFPPSLPGSCRPAVSAAAGTDVQLHVDQHLEDDLDFLFDGPTQHVSGSFSQPSQVKPALTVTSSEASSRRPTVGVSTPNDEFEDDWENDSLVLEMTQNPQNFTGPTHCSTQKPASQVKHHREAAAPPSATVRFGQSAGSRVEKESVRTTFRLESNPRWPVDYSSSPADKDTQRSSQCAAQACSSNTAKPQKPEFHRRTATSNTSPAETTQSFPEKPPHSEAPAASHFLDEDLDSFFSSDPVWDDPADDDLLCELCEDVENQIQSGNTVATKQTPPISQGSDRRTALQPTNRSWNSSILQPAAPCCSLAGGPACSVGVRVNLAKESFTSTRTKTLRGSTVRSTCPQGSGRIQPVQRPLLQHASNDHFTFKRPNKPVSTVTNKGAVSPTPRHPAHLSLTLHPAAGKCSAAEIELKKQQAMARRRQRLQAAQNLRAPT